MIWKFIVLAPVAGALLWAALALEQTEDKSHKLKSVSLRKMADSVHAVIAADRQAYLELVTARRPGESSTLPVHAQLLRHAAGNIQKQGAEFSYTLRSLWPINPSHGPQTAVEQAGLEAVVREPQAPFYTEEELGGRSYFTAVYADRATLASCAECHNRDTRSPKRDFQQGDVMGAIIVRVPLEF